MRVLVTGGAGYIGSHTVSRLVAAGHEVVVLDNLATGHAVAVGDVPLVVGDVTDPDAVERVVARGIDAVVHFAAHKSVAESVGAPGRYLRTNLGGTLTVLEAMARAGVERFVLSSTCAVYGTPDALPVTESTPTRPENPYGESKLMAERLLPWFERAHRIRSVALRYFNAAGAEPDGSNGEDWSAAANLVPLVMKAALGRLAAVEIYGTDYPTRDGTAIRDYVHVLDLADAHVRALEHLASGGPSAVLNLGTGRGSTVREVIATVEEVSGRPIPTIERPRRPGDPAAVWADAGAAERVLGWQARFDLREIVESAYTWHRRHPDGLGAAATLLPESATSGVGR